MESKPSGTLSLWEDLFDYGLGFENQLKDSVLFDVVRHLVSPLSYPSFRAS